MKLLSALTIAVTSAALVDAKYFSEGWHPGQPTTRAGPQATGNVGAWKLGNLPSSPPVAEPEIHEPSKRPGFMRALSESLTTATGFNVTGLYDRVQANEEFDRKTDIVDGFTRVTDSNFDELITYERFDLADDHATEDDRVWFLFVHGPPKDPSSFMFWHAVNNASILAQEPGKEIPGMKWGRVDFITELELTSRWLLFKPPMLVFATNRGNDLRFVRPGVIAANGTVIHRFLQEEHWRAFPVWESRYGPNGDRAWVPELYIKINKAWTRLTSIFPSWLLVVLSGVLSQALLTFMHRNDHKKAPKPVEGKTEDAAAVVEVETVPKKQSVEVKTPQKKAQAKTAKTKKGK
ncbi:hypothetical protein NliqN6_0444 [Naganishia liquefaciens]|uniref:Uncharacterized protein n=1 Tax=Naganishia liquefaciens TaxID=104408 RepID=A0A8H3YD80_9TREE|nr:hypothetical protein NliqN6_0444 [Naganishia liquefaciens]